MTGLPLGGVPLGPDFFALSKLVATMRLKAEEAKAVYEALPESQRRQYRFIEEVMDLVRSGQLGVECFRYLLPGSFVLMREPYRLAQDTPRELKMPPKPGESYPRLLYPPDFQSELIVGALLGHISVFNAASIARHLQKPHRGAEYL